MNPGSHKLSDEDLALAFGKGDQNAFQDLFERHSRTLVACIRRYVRLSAPEAEDMADDLVQEVWLRLFRGVNSFDPGRGSFTAWLFAIARNVALDAVRRRARSMPDPDSPGALSGAHSPPDRAARRFARSLAQSVECRAAALLAGIASCIRPVARSGFLLQHGSWFVHRCDRPPRKLTGFVGLISFRDGVFLTSL